MDPLAIDGIFHLVLLEKVTNVLYNKHPVQITMAFQMGYMMQGAGNCFLKGKKNSDTFLIRGYVQSQTVVARSSEDVLEEGHLNGLTGALIQSMFI